VIKQKEKAMGCKYLNSPIVEAVCEFRFLPETQWDMTVPGLFYERVKAEYPLKEKRLLVTNQPQTRTEEGITQETKFTPLAAFLSPDSKTFVQIGENHLLIHRIKPYLTWTQFKPAIQSNFQFLNEIIPNIKIGRIGLRYINRIEVPSVNINLDAYFELRPFLGAQLPQLITSFSIGCRFEYPESNSSCRVQLVSTPADAPENKAVTLDIDYYLNKPESVSPEDAMDWVESAHSKVESLFEGCITDRIREIMVEVKS
jgi:uncharacterized protein (TIGR04255 family)